MCCIVLWSAKRLSGKNISCLCQAISQLTNSESREFKDPAFVSHLTPTEHAKVIDLIGKKCMVKCLLNVL